MHSTLVALFYKFSSPFVASCTLVASCHAQAVLSVGKQLHTYVIYLDSTNNGRNLPVCQQLLDCKRISNSAHMIGHGESIIYGGSVFDEN